MKPISISDYKNLAKTKLKKEIFDYISGGADNEITAIENENAFSRIYLKPQVLRNVIQTDISSHVLGRDVNNPIMIAPTSFHKLVDEGGEVSTARAAQESNVPMVVSVMSCDSMESIAQHSNHQDLWFQVYFFKDRALTKFLVQQAETLGYKAIMLSVGIPCSGKRTRDMHNQFKFPKTLEVANLKGSMGGRTVDEFVKKQLDASATWDDIAWLKSITKLPIFLKGILNAHDAEMACQMQVQGIVVSNHGGRQLDTAIPSIYALPNIAQVINTRIDILFDGGIRRGSDVFKACALGANAVMLGRPTLWALACGGSEALKLMLSLLVHEFEMTMKLTGCNNLSDIKQFKSHMDLHGPS